MSHRIKEVAKTSKAHNQKRQRDRTSGNNTDNGKGPPKVKACTEATTRESKEEPKNTKSP